MDTIKLCAILTKATYQVYVTQGDQLLRYGSAVAISDAGHLLTAAHVITGETLETEAVDPALQFYARPAHGYLQPYRVEHCAISVRADYLLEPITIDLALLAPTQMLEQVPALVISSRPVTLGAEVLMAGFSHEIRPAFDFHNKVKDLQVDPTYLPKLEWLRQCSYEMMIKRGMVGQITPFQFGDSDGKIIEGDWFHIDNTLHPGASGGPVIDADGTLVGIITHTAGAFGSLADSPKIKVNVPSGSAIAVSPRALFSRPG